SASEKPESSESPVNLKNIGYENFISEGNLFIVLIPKGWGKKEKDFPYAYTKTKVYGVELSGPYNKDDARPTISVLYYEYGQFIKSYEKYINLIIGTFTRLTPEKDVYVTNTTVAGREAEKFEIETYELIMLPFARPDFEEGIIYQIVPPSKKVTVIERYIVIPAEKGFYVLNYSASLDIVKSIEGIFEKVLNSFEALIK
ncbi:MAG: hypothetical protein HY957_08285, partial [Nitrospirae bacterium]|nr:hypothetical protein [Nitrospirota bacterium]